jgi:hypothetical protein
VRAAPVFLTLLALGLAVVAILTVVWPGEERRKRSASERTRSASSLPAARPLRPFDDGLLGPDEFGARPGPQWIELENVAREFQADLSPSSAP